MQKRCIPQPVPERSLCEGVYSRCRATCCSRTPLRANPHARRVLNHELLKEGEGLALLHTTPYHVNPRPCKVSPHPCVLTHIPAGS